MIPESMKQPSRLIPDGAVLAGGKGRRMGGDKATLEMGGRTLLEIALELLRPLVGQIFIAGGIHQYPGSRTLPDLFPDAGPLSGLLTALSASCANRVLVLAVDMPMVRSATLEALLEASQNADITIPSTPDGRSHPLCGIYSLRCIQPARELLLADKRRVDGLLHRRDLVVQRISCEELGCHPGELANINTPEELEETRRRLERFSGR